MGGLAGVGPRWRAERVPIRNVETACGGRHVLRQAVPVKLWPCPTCLFASILQVNPQSARQVSPNQPGDEETVKPARDPGGRSPIKWCTNSHAPVGRS